MANWISSGIPACLFCALGHPPTRAANSNARRSAGSPDWCRPTELDRHAAVLLLPTCPQYCRTTPTDMRSFLWETGVIHDPSLHWPFLTHGRQRIATHFSQHCFIAPRCVRHYVVQRLMHTAAHCLVPDGPPLAPRFCALPATAIPRNTSSTALPDRRAPRLASGLPYMPQSASPAGPARSICPQNNST